MKKIYGVLFFFFFVLVASAEILPMDSIGVERRDGKTYVIHQVDPKETLFSISRRYNASVEVIKSENGGLAEGLKIGQIIKVLIAEAPTQTSSATKKHTVEAGQTLYTLSRIYSVTVDEIKRANNLSSNEISIGQEIIIPTSSVAQINQTSGTEVWPPKPVVKLDSTFKYHQVEAGQTLYTLARIYDKTVDQIKEINEMEGNTLSVGQYVKIEKKQSVPVKINKPVVLTEIPPKEEEMIENKPPAHVIAQKEAAIDQLEKNTIMTPMKEIKEAGLAEVIETPSDNKKYLVLHRTAKVGSVMKIRNEMNGMEIYARVVGKLPATGDNNKLLIKISKAAFEQLRAVDARFPVEISY
ncbi:LysM peptidoglycan-binding domain-containing protein [Penaeicola halotolerans]|uniref:LysM peptidoglycan-binding domain-containing protein n=1 Tax=Penaeicola halotolerans TaxID=2793196 RepID=UPI001CF880E8|nr:LysM peptidoglycan-binding domain-containing protein [Penaeicola halotolerans]